MAHQLTAIPAATHPNWRKLLSGQIDPPSTNLSFILLIFQLRLQCLHAAPEDGFAPFEGADINDHPKGWLSRTTKGQSGHLTERLMSRQAVMYPNDTAPGSRRRHQNAHRVLHLPSYRLRSIFTQQR
ncbi:MAG: hypothetical protein IT163_11435 [Bryobacterales bacterium]|nr:hypothetical protein [Bryobacterales bacterium]